MHPPHNSVQAFDPTMQTPSIPQSNLPPTPAAANASKQSSSGSEDPFQQSSGDVEVDSFDMFLGQTLAAQPAPAQLETAFPGEGEVAAALTESALPVANAFEAPSVENLARADMSSRIPALVLPDKVESTTIVGQTTNDSAIPFLDPNQAPLPATAGPLDSLNSAATIGEPGTATAASMNSALPAVASPLDAATVAAENPETVSSTEIGENTVATDSATSVPRPVTPSSQNAQTPDSALAAQSPDDFNLLDETSAQPTDDSAASQPTESTANIAQGTPNAGTPATSVSSAQATNATISIQATDHILSARQMMVDGKATLEVELDPPELGKVTIELVEEDSQLRGKLIIAESSSMELIKSSVPDMLRTLAEAGVMFSDLELANPGQEQQQSSRREYENVDQSQTSGENVAHHSTTNAARKHGINLIA